MRLETFVAQHRVDVIPLSQAGGSNKKLFKNLSRDRIHATPVGAILDQYQAWVRIGTRSTTHMVLVRAEIVNKQGNEVQFPQGNELLLSGTIHWVLHLGGERPIHMVSSYLHPRQRRTALSRLEQLLGSLVANNAMVVLGGDLNADHQNPRHVNHGDVCRLIGVGLKHLPTAGPTRKSAIWTTCWWRTYMGGGGATQGGLNLQPDDHEKSL